ncbi:MAG: hypothetical protein HY606_05935 [Planctomycetes bacterium]|nr:hypothetical protein [Planctomycetota bacterium]
MINNIIAVIVFGSLFLVIWSGAIDDKENYRCPQTEMKKGIVCSSCKYVMEVDGKPVFNHGVFNHIATEIEIDVCVRTYYKAKDCIKCEKLKFLDGDKSCGENGCKLATEVSYASLVDRCAVCGGSELAGEWKNIGHSKEKHSFYRCTKCMREMQKQDECCGKTAESVEKPVEIERNVCSKSGKFPHCLQIPPDATGYVISTASQDVTIDGEKVSLTIGVKPTCPLESEKNFKGDYYIYLTDKTTIFNTKGELLDHSNLKKGYAVKMWIIEPVEYSECAIKAVASKIIVEPAKRNICK